MGLTRRDKSNTDQFREYVFTCGVVILRLYLIVFARLCIQFSCMRNVHIVIKGKVHGVFFRATAKRVADTFNICGWVRNTFNDVEIKASGKEEDISGFIEWCHRGPDKARVDDVSVAEIAPENFNGFTINR